jgi:hypothetical protein
MGRHIQAIKPENFFPLLHWLYWYSIWVVVGVSFIKLSIAFFLLRLAKRTKYRNFLYGTIGTSSTPSGSQALETDCNSLPGCLHLHMCMHSHLPV